MYDLLAIAGDVLMSTIQFTNIYYVKGEVKENAKVMHFYS